MGYLDNSTITVDAVLTKVGRDLLASGQAINPVRIVFTDTEVDYRLWNPSHPSGSSFYGEAIEEMPLTEALVKADTFYRDRLVSLPQNTVRIPVITTSVDDGHTFISLAHLAVTLTTGNWAGSDKYIVIFPDITTLSAAPPAQLTAISGIGHAFIREAEMSNAMMAEVSGHTIDLVPQSTEINRTTQLTFMSVETGAYSQVDFTINANSMQRPVTTNPKGP